MGLGKQAKILTKSQEQAVLGFLLKTRHPIRNKVIFLLSIKAGLRAKEISAVTWQMVMNSDGGIADQLCLENSVSKGKSGGIIPLNKELKQALIELHASTKSPNPALPVIQTERQSKTSPQVIVNTLCGWYQVLGFNGCSSHSGRRSFITSAARKISSVGGSIRDVQALARHSSLAMTQRYIECDSEAQTKVVQLI